MSRRRNVSESGTDRTPLWAQRIIAAHLAVTDAVSHGGRIQSDRYFVFTRLSDSITTAIKPEASTPRRRSPALRTCSRNRISTLGGMSWRPPSTQRRSSGA